MPNRARSVVIGVALAAGALFWWLTATRFVRSNDEGIFLEASLRVLRGQVPYRDFFILMGPGAFWLQAAALKTLGVTLAASRAVTILDFSVIAGCMCWMLARSTGAMYGAWVAMIAMVFETMDPVVALPNHRWDSAAFAMLATALTMAGGRVRIATAGVCAACAAWITPTVALVGMALLAWMLISERKSAAYFLAGIFGVTAACAAALGAQGALVPFLHQMLWTGRQYGGANFMAYGTRFGGYAALFADAHGADLAARVPIVLVLSLPAILPPLVLLASLRAKRLGERDVRIMLAAGAAAVAATYPRMDVPHLVYAAPWFYVLAAQFAFGMRPKLKMAAFVAASLMCAVLLSYAISLRAASETVASRVGTIRATHEEANFIRRLEAEAPAGERFFAFPYLPLAYFLTLTQNPTRYSYLQPGLMSDADEQEALAELKARPPEKILYQDVSEQEILRIWPHSDPARLRLRAIEEYLKTSYRVRGSIAYGGGEFQILEIIRKSG